VERLDDKNILVDHGLVTEAATAMQDVMVEMSQSPEDMLAMLDASPRVQFLARNFPQVAWLLEEPEALREYLRRMQEVISPIAEALADPEATEKQMAALATSGALAEAVGDVLADTEMQQLLEDMASTEPLTIAVQSAEADLGDEQAALLEVDDASVHEVNPISQLLSKIRRPLVGEKADAFQATVGEPRMLRPAIATPAQPLMMARAAPKAAAVKKPAPKAAPKKAAAKPAPRKVVRAPKKAVAKPAPKKAVPRKVVPKRAVPKKFTPIKAGDVGTTKPLGVWDPLELMATRRDQYRRWQEMEIKHGRIAMAATTHVLLTEAGIRWPGFESIAQDIRFADIPGGTIASWEALPTLAWVQIVLIWGLLDNAILKQDPAKAAGDVIPSWFPWKRYDNELVRTRKLNIERNNGRLAMMGIFGMFANEALCGNPIYPLTIADQPVLNVLEDAENGPARVGSFLLASLGMAFVGGIAAIPEIQARQLAAADRRGRR